jgi:hypothetical protein
MLKSLKLSKSTFNGKEYKPRQNSLNKFYGKALKLQKLYAEYENKLIDKTLLSRIATAQLKPMGNEGEHLITFNQYLKERFACIKWFLTMDIDGNYSVVNAESLCEIMLADSDINHSEDRDIIPCETCKGTGDNEGELCKDCNGEGGRDEFMEYLDFMVSLLDDFFLNYNQSQNIDSLLAKTKETIQSETNSQKTS